MLDAQSWMFPRRKTSKAQSMPNDVLRKGMLAGRTGRQRSLPLHLDRDRSLRHRARAIASNIRERKLEPDGLQTRSTELGLRTRSPPKSMNRRSLGSDGDKSYHTGISRKSDSTKGSELPNRFPGQGKRLHQDISSKHEQPQGASESTNKKKEDQEETLGQRGSPVQSTRRKSASATTKSHTYVPSGPSSEPALLDKELLIQIKEQEAKKPGLKRQGAVESDLMELVKKEDEQNHKSQLVNNQKDEQHHKSDKPHKSYKSHKYHKSHKSHTTPDNQTKPSFHPDDQNPKSPSRSDSGRVRRKQEDKHIYKSGLLSKFQNFFHKTKKPQPHPTQVQPSTHGQLGDQEGQKSQRSPPSQRSPRSAPLPPVGYDHPDHDHHLATQRNLRLLDEENRDWAPIWQLSGKGRINRWFEEQSVLRGSAATARSNSMTSSELRQYKQMYPEAQSYKSSEDSKH